MTLRHLLIIAALQVRILARQPEHLALLVITPASFVASAALFDFAGKPQLIHFSLVAMSLLSIVQMGLTSASELFVTDRNSALLESMIVGVTPYPAVLGARILVTTSLGLIGAATGTALLTALFNADLRLHHPVLAFITLGATVLGAACVSLLLAAFICYARSARTVQNSISGPLLLLGGVLVPAYILDPWLQGLSKLVFLSWTSDLLRDCFRPEAPVDSARKLAMALATALPLGLGGAVMLAQMLSRLRSEGRLAGS